MSMTVLILTGLSFAAALFITIRLTVQEQCNRRLSNMLPESDRALLRLREIDGAELDLMVMDLCQCLRMHSRQCTGLLSREHLALLRYMDEYLSLCQEPDVWEVQNDGDVETED